MAEAKLESVYQVDSMDGEGDGSRSAIASSADPLPFDPPLISEGVPGTTTKTSLGYMEPADKVPGTVTKTSSGHGESDYKDFPGPESIIPLSPQWLLSKHGDSKPPLTPIDLPHTPVTSGNGGNPDSVTKERWRPDGNRDSDKRRDWWRTMPSEGDGGAGPRRDRWRDDERDSSLLARRDNRWKEGGDGMDSRKADRWSENSSTARDTVEGRRAPLSDRRSDSTSRDSSYEVRRDSKWNTRWGPEDKDKETRREKRSDMDKEGESHLHRQLSSNSRNDNERDVDTSSRDRWRPHSITTRSKGEVPPLSSTPPKSAPGFGTGRGRGDGTPSGFAVGRGRSHLTGGGPCHGAFPIGSPPGVGKGDASPGFHYPRAKLLDIYRKCCGSFTTHECPQGFFDVPPLTQSEPLEPLAFFTPDMDEEAVLEGILKGDILSSGAVHSLSKEQSNNKTRDNSNWNRARSRNNSGTKQDEGMREEAGLVVGQDAKAPKVKHDGHADSRVVDVIMDASSEIQGGKRDVDQQADVSDVVSSLEVDVVAGKPRAAADLADQVVGGRSGEEHTWPSAVGAENTDLVAKLVNLQLHRKSEPVEPADSRDKTRVVDSGVPPEELSLYYIDPQNEVQGPFPGADIIEWYKAGFFGTDLMVRLSDAPEGSPFSPLSNIMPHLQPKAQAEPGVNAIKEVEGYKDSVVKAEKEISPSTALPQLGVDQTPMVEWSLEDDRIVGHLRRVGTLHTEKGHFPMNNAEATRDVTTDKLLEQERASQIGGEAALLKRASSLPQRAASVTHVQREDLQSFLGQQWLERNNTVPETLELMSRASGRISPSRDLQAAPDVFAPPPFGSLPVDRAWTDLSATDLLKHQLPPQGVDALHFHHLQQLEKQRLQQQLGLSSQLGLPFLPYQPEAHSPSALRQQQLAEQLINAGLPHDFDAHALHQLTASRLPPRQQPSFPMPGTESTLDQLLRLQQQQQQPSSHTYLDQFLRHQQLPLLEHLHSSSPVLTERHLRRLHESSRMDFQAQQMEQLLQRELLLQRQEQQHQARQQAYLLQQQLSSKHRVSGVWEVDELGQFVQTQTSAPMHSYDFYQQQQQQQQQLQRQASFPGMQLPGAVPEGGSQLRLSRGELRRLAEMEMQRKLSSLSDGSASMPPDMLAQLQAEIARFEAQSMSMSEQQALFELQAARNRKGQPQADVGGEAVAGHQGWATGYGLDQMLVRGPGGASLSKDDVSKLLSLHSSFPGKRASSPSIALHEQQVGALPRTDRVTTPELLASVSGASSKVVPSVALTAMEASAPVLSHSFAQNVPLIAPIAKKGANIMNKNRPGVVGDFRSVSPAFYHEDVDALKTNMEKASARTLPIGTASLWPNASPCSMVPDARTTQSLMPINHNNVIAQRAIQQDDDASFWDYNIAGNSTHPSRAEWDDNVPMSSRDQFRNETVANVNDTLSRQASHGKLSGFSSAVSKPTQSSAKTVKQSGDASLNSQTSLTVEDAKAFRQWCEQQINLRREPTEYTTDHPVSGPTMGALEVEYLSRKESMPVDAKHGPHPASSEVMSGDGAGSLNSGMEKKTLVVSKKSLEGEEEPEQEAVTGQSSALKGGKKKSKKGKKVVDPSLLGFSVTSNRMLMGEIQHVDD